MIPEWCDIPKPGEGKFVYDDTPVGQNIPGGRCREVRDAIMEVSSRHEITHCVVHVGTNFVPQEKPTAVTRELIHLMKEIRHNMPKSSLHFSGILPKYDSSFLSGIDQINRSLYFESFRGYFNYIGHGQFAQNGVINTRLLSNDSS